MKRGVVSAFVALIFTALLAIPICASPVLITDIQYWLAPDHIQIIISFNSAVQSSYHHSSNPPRFVLEIPNCENMYGDQKIPVNDIILQQIRVQRLSSGTTQVVFDLTEKMTLSHVNNWFEDVVRSVGHIPTLVIGNKMDLVDYHEGEEEPNMIKKAKKLCSLLGIELFLTSAKTGFQMNEIFELLTMKMIDHNK